MRILIATGVMLFMFLSAIGQKQASNWFFGDSVSIEFKPGGVVVGSRSAMYAQEGCTCASDANGNLLFYSNGQKVWNRQHQVMAGGDSLHGDPDVTQSVLCIAQPGAPPRYWYLFVNSPNTYRKLTCYTIDMELNNGLGAVTASNLDLMNGPSERITAVNHCNGRDVWLVAHRQSNNLFYSFLVCLEGVVAQPVVSDVGLPYDMNGSGYLKAAPSGHFLAMGMRSGNVVMALMRFNNQTGGVSNPVFIASGGISYCYGLAFSHDSRRLYAGIGGEQYKIMQYDLTHQPWADVSSTAYRVSLGNNYGFQEAPDGCIYVAQVNGSWLGCILHPSELGARCDYVPNSLFIGGNRCRMGLPAFNQSLFNRRVLEPRQVCEENQLTLRLWPSAVVDSIVWYPDFTGDLSWRITSYADSVGMAYAEQGTYQVGAVVWHCGTADTVYGTIVVSAAPDVDLGADTVLFEGQSVFFQLGGVDSCLWHDGSTEVSRWVTHSGVYSVTGWNGVCYNSDTISISNRRIVVYMPNVFTPDGDGANDFWSPVVPASTGYRVQVYDRFGARVAEIVPGSQGWDGSVGGKPCAEGVYMWVLDHPPDQQTFGSVMVLR